MCVGVSGGCGVGISRQSARACAVKRDDLAPGSLCAVSPHSDPG